MDQPQRGPAYAGYAGKVGEVMQARIDAIEFVRAVDSYRELLDMHWHMERLADSLDEMQEMDKLLCYAHDRFDAADQLSRKSWGE